MSNCTNNNITTVIYDGTISSEKTVSNIGFSKFVVRASDRGTRGYKPGYTNSLASQACRAKRRYSQITDADPGHRHISIFQ